MTNIFGAGIKFITGNLDNSDAEEIRKQLIALELNQKKFMPNGNIHNRLTQLFNDELKNITHHNYLDNRQMANGTKNISNAIEDLLVNLTLWQYENIKTGLLHNSNKLVFYYLNTRNDNSGM